MFLKVAIINDMEVIVRPNRKFKDTADMMDWAKEVMFELAGVKYKKELKSN